MFLNFLHKTSSSLICCSFSFRQLLIVFILVFTWYENSQASRNQLDRDSLLSIYNGLSTSSPLNWSVSIDCCSWEGVTCANNGRVSRLWLPSRGLGGTISASITNLSYLEQLSFAHNQLSGHLPERLFLSLNRLEMIDLSYNILSGRLNTSSHHLSTTIKTVDLSCNNFKGLVHPSFLQPARNLLSFNVSNNSFHGQLPSSICNFSASIRLIDFSCNHFSGSVPYGFGTCSKLKVLRAGFNSITGSLPGDIFSLSTLQEISFPSNKISGPLSDGIVNLTSLKVLEFSANELTGSIPHDIGKLYNLEQLLLHINFLEGTLPLSLMNCTRLIKLILSVNNLSGEISGFDFSNLLQLRTIDLANNLFNGSFPVSIASCSSLTTINLSINQLTGEIQPEIKSLQSLSFFSVSKNSLTNITGAIKILSGCQNLSVLILAGNFYNESLSNEGSLVSDGFPNLMVLGLGKCQLNGRIPIWLAKVRKLEVLDLSFNVFTGPIPDWLGALPNLFHLDLSKNSLSGELSVEIIGLPRLVSKQSAEVHDSYTEFPDPLRRREISLSVLEYNRLAGFPPAIYLSGNNLSGNIPVEIGQLKYIHVLDLSANQLSGSIPDTISNLINLEKLDLSGNHLSGRIPSSLTNLHFLSAFSVANNNLQGPIPTGGQFDTFPEASFQGNPGLCGQLQGYPCTDLPKTMPAPSTPGRVSLEMIIFWLTFGIAFGISFSVSFVVVGKYSRKCPPGSCYRKIFYQL